MQSGNEGKLGALDSVTLCQRCSSGDEEALAEISRRYSARLIGLVRPRLSARLRSRVDAEDVIQSALASFLRCATQDRFRVTGTGDLWRLLVEIALNKAAAQVRYHTAQKRDVRREQSMIVRRDGVEVDLERLSAFLERGPSAEDVLALQELLESIFQTFKPEERRIIELRLQGYDLNEIVTQVQRSDRTVRRCLDKLKGRLEATLLSSSGSSP